MDTISIAQTLLSSLGEDQIKGIEALLSQEQVSQLEELLKLSSPVTESELGERGLYFKEIKNWSVISPGWDNEGFLVIDDYEVPADLLWYYGDNIYGYKIWWAIMLVHIDINRDWSIQHIFEKSAINILEPEYAFLTKELKVKYEGWIIKTFLLNWWEHSGKWVNFLGPKVSL
jgi:hypothetical protein